MWSCMHGPMCVWVWPHTAQPIRLKWILNIICYTIYIHKNNFGRRVAWCFFFFFFSSSGLWAVAFLQLEAIYQRYLMGPSLTYIFITNTHIHSGIGASGSLPTTTMGKKGRITSHSQCSMADIYSTLALIRQYQAAGTHTRLNESQSTHIAYIYI